MFAPRPQHASAHIQQSQLVFLADQPWQSRKLFRWSLNCGSWASDVDVLVEFEGRVSLFDLIGLQLDLQELLDVPKVDVVMRDAIYPAIKDDILSEAIDVGPPEVALQDRAHS